MRHFLVGKKKPASISRWNWTQALDRQICELWEYLTASPNILYPSTSLENETFKTKKVKMCCSWEVLEQGIIASIRFWIQVRFVPGELQEESEGPLPWSERKSGEDGGPQWLRLTWGVHCQQNVGWECSAGLNQEVQRKSSYFCAQVAWRKMCWGVTELLWTLNIL